jgi:hypothetical protein
MPPSPVVRGNPLETEKRLHCIYLESDSKFMCGLLSRCTLLTKSKAIIAMQDSISDVAAVAFATMF